MTLPLHLFGGWLQLFYAGNLVGIIASIWWGYISLSTIATSRTMELKIVYLILLANLIAYFILTLNILRIVKIKDEKIPEKIVRLLTWIIVLFVASSTIAGVLSYQFFGSVSSAFIKEIEGDIGRAIVSWIIWASYFMKSKRVNSYYGRGSSKLLKF